MKDAKDQNQVNGQRKEAPEAPETYDDYGSNVEPLPGLADFDFGFGEPEAPRRSVPGYINARTNVPGLKKLQTQDPDFDLTDFLMGAGTAFEMILQAYAAGDEDTLEKLVHADVLKAFQAGIRERRAKDQIKETTLVEMDSVDARKVALAGSEARVTVEFVSKQINLIKDSENRILEGDPVEPETIIDKWTFARDIRADNPNWILVET